MAKEILVIGRTQVIFFKLYATAPIVIGGEPQLLSGPSTDLPLEAAAFITADNPNLLDLIDDGRVVWEIVPVEKGFNESLPHLAARYKEKWQGWADEETARIQSWADDLAAMTWINV